MNASEGKQVQFQVFSNIVVEGRGSSLLLPDGFIPRERASGLHCKRSWVGPRTKLDRMEREIFLHLQEKRPRFLGRCY